MSQADDAHKHDASSMVLAYRKALQQLFEDQAISPLQQQLLRVHYAAKHHQTSWLHLARAIRGYPDAKGQSHVLYQHYEVLAADLNRVLKVLGQPSADVPLALLLEASSLEALTRQHKARRLSALFIAAAAGLAWLEPATKPAQPASRGTVIRQMTELEFVVWMHTWQQLLNNKLPRAGEAEELAVLQHYLRQESLWRRSRHAATTPATPSASLSIAQQAFLKQLHEQFQADFLAADAYYQQHGAASLPETLYQQEKVRFVAYWFRDYYRARGQTAPSLDKQQLAAIAASSGHVQLVARAGSGKTRTLVYRVLFLLQHCRVPANAVLLLAFNRAAALEMRQRLLFLLHPDAQTQLERLRKERPPQVAKPSRQQREALEASLIQATAEHLQLNLPHIMTFHALAYALVHPESLLVDDASASLEPQSRSVQTIIDDHLAQPVYYQQIRTLMLRRFREDWERLIAGHYHQGQEALLHYRRSLPNESMQGEMLKSYGEKLIADFLFEHGIAYVYERNHWWKGRNYKPDFTLFQTPTSGVIIEYFGLHGDADYDAMSEQKRAYWQEKAQWQLLEFSAADVMDTEGFCKQLQAALVAQGIACTRLSEEEIWLRIRDRAIDRFTRAIKMFIGRCRKHMLSVEALLACMDHHAPINELETMFLNLAARFYAAYLERLQATGEQDFDAVLQRAAELVQEGQTLFAQRNASGDIAALRYVYIDEFQDFSELFYRLLSAMQQQNPQLVLFCVGDDWQAINGFAGSDTRFFDSFSEYFGAAQRLYLTTNYRSARAIVSIGNALMQGAGEPARPHRKDPGKVLLADLHTFQPTSLEYQHYPADSLTPAVLRLVQWAAQQGQRVVLLNRRQYIHHYLHTRDAKQLDNFVVMLRKALPKAWQNYVSASTTHGYKGREHDVVIVLDAVAGSYPLIHPNWLFTRMFGDNPESISQEEQRLFYVALSRASEALIILSDSRKPSPFVQTIRQHVHLPILSWSEYAPLPTGQAGYYTVEVHNQRSRSGTATFAIKDLLKASGYRWNSAAPKAWIKSFVAKTFRLEQLQAELWAQQADGVDVRIYSEQQTLQGRYIVYGGKWRALQPYLSKHS